MNGRSASWQSNTVAALICLVGLIAHAGNARAADQIVTDFGDSGGPNQLRAKINAAQATGGGTISFAGSGTVILSGAQLPNITAEVTIDGGPSGVTISGGNGSRIMFVAAGSKLTLRNLTFTKGNSGTSDGGALWTEAAVVIENCKFIENQAMAPNSGGAIVAYQPLTIRNSEFALNKAGGGGAIYSRFGTAVTTLTDCDFRDNQATGGSGGGALLLWDGAPVTMNRTQFRNNKATQADGGAAHVTANSRLNAANSQFTDNFGFHRGGAISNHGRLDLVKTTMTGNTTFVSAGSAASGGSIHNAAQATAFLSEIRITGNPAVVQPSARAGGAISNAGLLVLSNGTIDGNKAEFHGGGIAHGNTATTDLTNVTFSGNATVSAQLSGGAISAIGTNPGSVRLTNVTFAGNLAANGAGGAIFSSPGSNIVAKNTLFVRAASAGNCTLLSDDGTGQANGVLKGEFNLADDGTCRIGGGRDNVAAPLGPLQNNGGFTPTHLPQPGSPAIDNGTVSGAPPRDQRGYLRAGAAPDVGAAEFAGTIPVTLANISTRLRVETGDNALIGGFIVTGDGPKRLIARAIAPSLGLDGALADPQLEIYNGDGELVAANDNWQEAPNRQEIIDSAIAPSHPLESAILRPVAPGAYTALVTGVNGGTGVALVEVYDLDRTAGSKLANISTRGLVQTGDDVMIGGTIVVGSENQLLLIRALGPSLPVAGKLPDPSLELYDGNGTLLQANDNWRTDQEAAIIATTIPPTNNLESAIVREVVPGPYTAIVRGVNDTTGVGLVEVYALE